MKKKGNKKVSVPRQEIIDDPIATLYIFRISHTYFNKWKNHFSEMKGDVGMSLHEKEGEQEDA